MSWSQLKPEVVYTTGHTTQINALGASSDNKFLASAGNNKLIKIWDIESGREFRTLDGSGGRFIHVFFAPNNTTLIGITTEHEMIGWDVISGEILFEVSAYGTSKIPYNYINDEVILFINADNHLATFNTKDKTIKILNDQYITSLGINKKKNEFYTFNHLGEMTIYELKSLLKKSSVQLENKNIHPLMMPKISNDGRYLITVLNDHSFQIVDVEKNKVIFNKKITKSTIASFDVDPKKSLIYISFNSGELVVYDYQKSAIIERLKVKSMFPIINTMTTYSEGGVLIISNFDIIRFYKVDSKQFFKILEPKIKPIINMAYDQKGKYLAVARTKGTIEIWDLRFNKIKLEVKGLFPCQFSPDGDNFNCMSYSLNILEYETENWKQTSSYNTLGSLFQVMTYSKDGKYLAIGGFIPSIKIFDTSTKKHVKSLTGQMGVKAIDFHPSQPYLVSSGIDMSCKVWSLTSEKVIHTFPASNTITSGVKYSPDGLKIATTAWDKTISIYNSKNYAKIKSWKGHKSNIGGLDFNANGDVLMTYGNGESVFDADKSVIFWHLNGEKITEINSHNSSINQAFFDLEADYVFSASEDGSIKINDYKSKSVLVTYVSTGEKEFIIYTPDNYYMASRQALSSIAFRLGENLVPFDQFDILLNRPDIVAKKINKTPEQLIRAYEYLYKKRLRKYNLDEGSLKLDYALPQVKIETTLPLITSQGIVNIEVKVWDEKYDLKQLNVYVNGSPIYGEEGYRPKSNVKSFRKVIDVALVQGKNNIQVSCINANGNESYYDSKEIFKEKTSTKNDLYFVAIGVSSYKDSRFNLTYPIKDAKDMVSKMEETQNLYGNVYTKLLLNDEVNIENIRSLTSFFENCKPGDLAGVFIAGHGLLDENFDYYFGTYDVDFNNPSLNGLAYAEIHKLLNSIKAYRKLLIMDTCHSGELDKEEVESRGGEVEMEAGDIEFRSAGSMVELKSSFGFENSIELTQDLFSDTRKGSGATVISSAGGAEFAMESDEWKNGLFTFVFLNGLTNNTADFNKDGAVTISEIRRYVNEEVSKLSKGMQVPNSREENLSVDYVIF